MSRAKIDDPVQFLTENGILFEMNRQVLHPLGLELHFRLDDDGRVTRIDLLDNRPSPEPIYFGKEAFEEGRQRFEKYLDEHGRQNMKKRRQLGMVVQTGPNLPHQFHDGSDNG